MAPMPSKSEVNFMYKSRRVWIPVFLIAGAVAVCLFWGSVVTAAGKSPEWHMYLQPAAHIPEKYQPQTEFIHSHECTLEDDDQCAQLDKKFTLYWNMRWDNHYKFHDIRWGRYNGCHKWKNNTRGTVLWLYLPNHLKAVAHRNWKAFLQESHPAGCYFVVFATRGSLYQKGSLEGSKFMRNDEPADYTRKVASILEEVSQYLGGSNVAWYIASRVNPGPNPCNWTSHDWPNAASDYLVSATSFGAYVARAHGIPTTPYDILLHSRPDLWFGRVFDHDELHSFAVRNHQQLQIGFRQTSDFAVGDEDPANQIIITTRGVVEDTCLHNWVFDPGAPQCGACRGQLGARLSNDGGVKDRSHPEYWSCGHEHISAMQAMSRAGARSFFGNPLFYMALSSEDIHARVQVNEFGAGHGMCGGFDVTKDTPPCTLEKISLLDDSYEFFHSLDGDDATSACVVGNYNQRKGVDEYLYKTPETSTMPTFMVGTRGPILDSAVFNYTLLDHPTRGLVMLRGPMFFRGFLWLTFTPMLVPRAHEHTT